MGGRGFGSPFFCEWFVAEGFDEYSSDDAAGLKAYLLAGFGVVPIRHGDAAGGLVGPAIDGLDEGLKICGTIGESGGP